MLFRGMARNANDIYIDLSIRHYIDEGSCIVEALLVGDLACFFQWARIGASGGRESLISTIGNRIYGLPVAAGMDIIVFVIIFIVVFVFVFVVWFI